MTKYYLNKTDVAKILNICEAYALKKIRSFNTELEEKGFITMRGKAPTKLFLERYGLKWEGLKDDYK